MTLSVSGIGFVVIQIISFPPTASAMFTL